MTEACSSWVSLTTRRSWYEQYLVNFVRSHLSLWTAVAADFVFKFMNLWDVVDVRGGSFAWRRALRTSPQS